MRRLPFFADTLFGPARSLGCAGIAVALLGLAATPASANERLTVLLDWFINPDHGPLIVAHEQGFFDEVGLDVTMIEPADPNDPPKLVAAGSGDVAVSYQPQLHLLVDAGLPLKRIGTLVASPLNSLVVLRDGPIASIGDLAGKRVGYSVGGFEEAVLGAMLEQHGLSLADVALININFSLSPSLMSGQVDAVIGAFRNFELNQMELAGRPGLAFFPEEEGVPAYDELIFLAHADRAGDPRLASFLAAIEKATQYIINHPDETLETFVASGDELDNALNRRAWYDTLPRFALRPRALDHKRYDHFSAFLRDRGLIETKLPVEAYAVDPGVTTSHP